MSTLWFVLAGAFGAITLAFVLAGDWDSTLVRASQVAMALYIAVLLREKEQRRRAARDWQRRYFGRRA